MDENIDSNYEDNVFSHVAAKICGLVSDYLGNEKIGEPVKKCLRGKKIPSREKKAKRSSNKAFKWSNSYKVGENMQITHKFACSIYYEQDTDLYPDETAGETATRSTRVNTPRGINSTKGRSAAVLTDRSQRNPSPTECSLPRSVWGSQPLPRDNYGLSSNINEAITTSQEGNFSNPSTNAEQTTTMSESTNLERKESFDPNNFWDESYPSYHSSNNEDFFKRTYLHQPNEQIDPSYPLYIPQDGESNTGFGIFSELPQIRTDTAIVQ
ncbi:hypothetical protein PNOK_0508000 [Pyrrhoderma noxium]|uniref:Uncharacterized protein n=1 Tax=Pyrrhoderma noxium TaxID=2282107 RepID=A0A286UKK4_9AGAM|nr:hypothetical protein PNOK_0508000 [Pyrrhoderma noxium]